MGITPSLQDGCDVYDIPVVETTGYHYIIPPG